MADEFIAGLKRTHQQARALEIPLDTPVSEFFRVNEETSTSDESGILQVGGTHFAMPINELANPSFATALTSWTSTLTVVHDTFAPSEYGAIGSAKMTRS